MFFITISFYCTCWKKVLRFWVTVEFKKRENKVGNVHTQSLTNLRKYKSVLCRQIRGEWSELNPEQGARDAGRRHLVHNNLQDHSCASPQHAINIAVTAPAEKNVNQNKKKRIVDDGVPRELRKMSSKTKKEQPCLNVKRHFQNGCVRVRDLMRSL